MYEAYLIDQLMVGPYMYMRGKKEDNASEVPYEENK
jgi:hypothetical protein